MTEQKNAPDGKRIGPEDSAEVDSPVDPPGEMSLQPNMEPSQIRLQKYLADAGIASRRHCEELIRAGRVRLNGETVQAAGTKVTPGVDQVQLDGADVVPRTSGHAYYLFSKPAGCLVTASDPRNRSTIYDFLQGIPERVVPVGRLDLDSEGLLLLTNDGEMAHRLMHPRFTVEKEYHVWVTSRLDDESLAQLRSGVEIDEGMTRPAKVELLARDRRTIRVIITEGRKRQVRQMMAAVGTEVTRLVRVREGSLQLGSLAPGTWRPLTDTEIAALRHETGL